MGNMKKVLVLMSFLVVLTFFMGAVSAVSLNSSDMALASSGVKNYTEANGHISSYVNVNGKNSTTPSFLKSLTAYTAELGSGSTAPVDIVTGVRTAPNPAGSTTGKIYKTEYLDMASRASNFITANGYAPNYSKSSLGNIRYESLVYAYSKIINYYALHGALPNYVTIVCYAGTSSTGLTIDNIPPTVTCDLPSGTYDTSKNATLTATDNVNSNPTIYYSLDGSTPTTSSTRYTGPVSIVNPGSTVLKFMAMDTAGNKAAVQTVNYILNLVKDVNTGKVYSKIQDAIDDSSTSNDDVITLQSGTYIENIIINKQLTLMPTPGATPTIQALNPINPVITINSGGTGSIIKYLTIKSIENFTGPNADNFADLSGVFLNGTSNCTINENSFLNTAEGIYLDGGSNNKIQNNTITNIFAYGISLSNTLNNTINGNVITTLPSAANNTCTGIFIGFSRYNLINRNIITNNQFGIYPYGSNNNIITENIIKNNSNYGIYLYNSSATINFNIISGNIAYGLKNDDNSTINATNNWWGTNNPTVSTDNGSDINSANGTTYAPWLILNTTVNPTVTKDNSTVTADLTHNNTGGDTSPQGHIPDNIPVNFATNLGTITNTAYTRNGKASATFNCGTSTSGTATITTTLDKQSSQNNITIDILPLKITANLPGGVYNSTQVVTLTANDDFGFNSTIYYTLDGSTPTTSSTRYTSPINIVNPGSTVLKFMAVDNAGNEAAVQTVNYILNLVKDVNTGKTYSKIQDAIDDSSTSNGDVITLQSGTYIENIIINKQLTLMPAPGATPTIQALDPSNPVITINSGGTGSTIKYLTIEGSTGADGVFLNGTSNCTIYENSFLNNDAGIELEGGSNNNTIQNNTINNNFDGINLINSSNNTVNGNTVTKNTWSGILIQYSSNNNKIQNNTINNNSDGINLINSSNNIITGNTITNNENTGITSYNSTVNINFNVIFGNTVYGLENDDNSTINATNNWWGTNNPTVSTDNGSDIYSANGTTYAPWLILNTTASSTNSHENTNITVDLTQNSNGEDTSSEGHVPDNIPVNFATNLGTVTNTAYTRNGKASATFNCGTSTSGTATITTTLNNQTVELNLSLNDTQLVVTVNPVGSLYNTTQNVTLNGGNSTIYYTLDGSDPGLNGTVYSNPIPINTTTTLRYIATDNHGNWSPEYTQNYIIDTTAPTTTVNIKGGVYSTTQTMTLTATDNLDPNPIIYYTMDGTDPTTSSTRYTGPITLQMNSTTKTAVTLKFMAVDNAGNKEQIQTETYTLTLPIVDINNNNTYTSIQDAVNDPLTLKGDTIQVYSGTYTETITVNKKLLIMPVSGNNVTIKAADSTGSAFIITSGGSGSVIEGFTVYGNINLEANNCTIYLNNIVGNGTAGILAFNSFNNTILNNIISANGFDGIWSNSSSNTIYGNTISGCEVGIYSENSTDKITSNNIINNHYGIWTYNSTENIQFNRITGNSYGLKNDIGTVNATDNWWGSNSDPSTISGDICNESGTVIYNPWLVLSLTPSSTNSGGNTSVTADLTHNNTGGDTSSTGHVPDNIPVNFTTTFGTITGLAYTVKGKATTILNLGSTQNTTVTTTANLDNQTINTTGLITTGTAIITITGTCIDDSTGQPLNITYNIPLNESVTWFGILGIPGTIGSTPVDYLKVIVDGIVVVEKTLYPSSSAAVDTITINIVYPGVAGYNITVTDPNSTTTMNLTFPGNNIQRISKLTFMGSPFDFLQSFAIATTDVTNTVAQYWVNQQSNYTSSSAMNAAYNAFLASLMVEYIHDQIADSIASTYNVTWSRTNPIMVSFCEDRSTMYLTLDCDHSMGMTVVGTTINMWAFNFISSSFISLIEGAVMNASTNGTFGSITMDIINAYLSNSTSLEIFMQNISIIEENGNEFITIDPETGIMRDINTTTNLCGITDYFWGDIQLERWIVEHWGEIVTQAAISLIQVFSDVINDVNDKIHKRWEKFIENYTSFKNQWDDYFTDFPAPVPTDGDSIIGLLEGDPYSFLLGYSLDISIWQVKHHWQDDISPLIYPVVYENITANSINNHVTHLISQIKQVV
jgi:parallel beta-helix repeat protein